MLTPDSISDRSALVTAFPAAPPRPAPRRTRIAKTSTEAQVRQKRGGKHEQKDGER